MQKTFRACFYTGTRPGVPGLYNRVVRARANGRFSHAELQFSDGWSASASFADGGTRFKWIEYTSGDWVFLDLPLEWEPYARVWFIREVAMNRGYDVMGNLHLALGFFPHSFGKNFCSEALAAALRVDESFRLEPNALYVVLKRMVEVHWEAKLREAA